MSTKRVEHIIVRRLSREGLFPAQNRKTLREKLHTRFSYPPSIHPIRHDAKRTKNDCP